MQSKHQPHAEVDRFRRIFRRVHAEHPGCLTDEWIHDTCRDAAGRDVDRPYVWSRRNGPWRQTDTLLVGAAPGNAGGRGGGSMGAHATRIPFGGDIAGGNLDVLLASSGLTRNDAFITAALNHLPEKGGGEPTLRELLERVGEYASSLHLLRDTVLAVGPRLIVALGNVALRATAAAVGLAGGAARLPSLERLRRFGLERGACVPWPHELQPDPAFAEAWADAWGARGLPHVLWLTHPSAQNMSPYAGVGTAFHTRMVAARDALRHAVRRALGEAACGRSAASPEHGVYALPEWRARVGPRHAQLAELWKAKGV